MMRGVSVIDQVTSVPYRSARSGRPSRWSKWLFRRLSLLVIAVVAAACLVDVTPGVSYAGFNGQELGVYSYNAHSIEICGPNQNGKTVCGGFNLAGLGLNNVNGW